MDFVHCLISMFLKNKKQKTNYQELPIIPCDHVQPVTCFAGTDIYIAGFCNYKPNEPFTIIK